MITKILILLISFILPFSQILLMPRAMAVSPHIVISEVVPDGGGGATQEFIELYNNSNSDVSMAGWTVQLRSATGAINRTLSLGDVLRGRQYALLSSTSYTAPCASADFTCFSASMSASGGHVYLLDNTDAVVDKLGWGTANAPEGTAAAIPLFGVASLTRKDTNTNGVLQDTDNNLQDFISSGTHTPIGGGVYELPPVVDVCPNIEGMQVTVPSGHQLVGSNCELITDPDPQPVPICLGVSISEILPNPSGDDTGNEYIELYNETSAPVDLTGCILKVGTAQQVLSESIDPGYKAFYGLTLPNSAGGQVSLVTNTYTVSVTYPANLGDNEAYGFIDGAWQQGLSPSPGTVNALPTEHEGEDDSSEEFTACGPGKYRHPETNRCRNIEVESGLASCDPGQVRNPETNRCRSATTTASTLAACGADETRNPETNRCRKNISSTSAQTPCQPGQERNPETNRCRKVAAAKTTNPLTNPASASKKPVSYYVLGIVAVLAAGYGIFEYRTQIRDFFIKRRRKAQG